MSDKCAELCKWIGPLKRRQGVDRDRQQEGFAEFYEFSRDPCLRAVLASVGNRQLAEDLVADAFAKAWSSWPKVGRHPAPQAWVVRTALNTNVSWWRKRHREVELTNHDGALPELSDGMDDALMAAVRHLPDRQREVLVIRVFLDLDTATTAKALGIAEGTVMSHLSRAAAALRRSYTEAHPTEPCVPTVSLAQPREGQANE